MNHPLPELADAIVLHANHATIFSALRFTCCQSWHFQYCTEGHYVAIVNGTRLEMAAGRWIFMPWNHAVTYEITRHVPPWVVSAHLVPNLPPGREYPLRFDVPHHVRQNDSDSVRQNVEHPLFCAPFMRALPSRSALPHLLQAVASWFDQGRQEECSARMFAQLLLREAHWQLTTNPSAPLMAPALARAIDYLEHHLSESFNGPQLARLAGCSLATLHRHFWRAFEMPPARWLAYRRLDVARQLLRDTETPAKLIAHSVGFADLPTFYKRFRQVHGLGVREFRQQLRRSGAAIAGTRSPVAVASK